MYSVARRGACVFKRLGEEVTSLFIDVFDWHELLVEDDLLIAVGCFDADDATDVF